MNPRFGALVNTRRDEAKTLAVLPGRSIRRWTFALLGLLSVAVGFLGVFVPGLPTTVFLLLASYCFTRSCPWLEDKFVRAPIFRPYLKYLDREEGMPLRARIVTIAMIWIASTTSCLVMYFRGELASWFVIAIGSAALIGSIVVSRVFPAPAQPEGGDTNGSDHVKSLDRVGETVSESVDDSEPSMGAKRDLPEDEPPRCPIRRS